MVSTEVSAVLAASMATVFGRDVNASPSGGKWIVNTDNRVFEDLGKNTSRRRGAPTGHEFEADPKEIGKRRG
jgi:hypothetical protein